MDISDFTRVEDVSFRVWMNLRHKFHSEYSQFILHVCLTNHLPVFVRWNNRNVYAHVEHIPEHDFYEVFDFYRLTRDGFPVKFIVSDHDGEYPFERFRPDLKYGQAFPFSISINISLYHRSDFEFLPIRHQCTGIVHSVCCGQACVLAVLMRIKPFLSVRRVGADASRQRFPLVCFFFPFFLHSKLEQNLGICRYNFVSAILSRHLPQKGFTYDVV